MLVAPLVNGKAIETIGFLPEECHSTFEQTDLSVILYAAICVLQTTWLVTGQVYALYYVAYARILRRVLSIPWDCGTGQDTGF